ncbi:BglG family transcription antiterminator [Intestinibacter sp.]|uniref:BglG family transcription antiterminator n=1 Tax=Intestinibacter sp. TaxID=1965304 RepID=UPI002A74DE19|nr:BglG family transcription antiterminator [Intestinibacter sp.]MDY2734920.1 BglG family transcription antiterminator [Intestinibacter sp.]
MKRKKISSRQKEIILMLAQNPSNKPITISEVAQQLNISTRTVLRDMSSIENWLDENDFKFVKKPGVGIYLDETLDSKQFIIELLQEEKIEKSYTKEERKRFILSNLLTSSEPIKSYYFYKTLKISEGTLNNDFIDIEAWLDKFSINLIRKPGTGIYIEGSEKNIRSAQVNLIYNSCEEQELMNMVKNVGNNIQNSSVIEISSENRLLNLIDKSIIKKVENSLSEVIKEINLKISDSSFIGLVVHISLAVQRLKNGERISMEEDVLNELKCIDQFKMATKIAEQIGEEFDINVPIEEIGYITMHLRGSKMRLETKDHNFTLDDVELMKISKQLIELAEDEFKLDFKNDTRLLNDLVTHLGPSLCRIKMGMDIRNPLLQQIKTEYKDVYDGVANIIYIIKEKLDIDEIPESEIAYLAMHFGSSMERNLMDDVEINAMACCPTGIGTSRFLITKLHKKFSNLNMVDTISAINIDDEYLRQQGIDLIISTVELDSSIKNIVVSPLLNLEDVTKIRHVLRNIAKDKVFKNDIRAERLEEKKEKNLVDKNEVMDFMTMSGNLVEFFKLLEVHEDVDCDDIEELVNYSSFIFANDSKSALKIQRDLKRRINISTPFVDGIEIALLHCMTQEVKNIRYASIRLSKEVMIDKENKTRYALLMLIPKEAKDYQRELLSKISENLIENDDFVNCIKYGNKEEIKENFKSIVLDFYINKMKVISQKID